MNQSKLALLGIPLLALMMMVSSGLFVVNQTEQALVLQFGELKRVIQKPGLNFKIPFIQTVDFYDNRILDVDLSAIELTAGDQKRIIVDTFTRYKIVDPARFFQTVRNEQGVRNRLAALIPGSLRSVLGGVPLSKLLTSQRESVMRSIREQVNGSAKGLGIEVVDVRISRADLPKENSEAVFNRMISERQREAQEIRAKGTEIAQTIRAEADKEKILILAEANKQASILRGQGDAESIKVYANAYNQSPDFAIFYRTLEAYSSALSEKTEYLLMPQGEFFKYFNRSNF